MRTIRIIVALVIVTAIARAQTPPTDPQASPTPSPEPKSLVAEWESKLPAGDEHSAAPFIVPGLTQVFVAGDRIGVEAHNSATGLAQWRWKNESAGTRVAPVLAGGRIIAVGDGTIDALDQQTGAPAWTANFEGEPVAAFAAGERAGVIVNGFAEAWDATGKSVWRKPTGGIVITPVVAASGVLIFGTDRPALTALDAATGEQKWSVPLPTKPSSLVATAERAYFAGQNGHLYSYQITGEVKEKWNQPRIRAIGQPVVDQKFVYFSLLDNSVRAFAAGGGTEKWDQPLESRPMTGPFRLGDNVAVALGNGHVVELSAKNGKLVTLPKETAATPVRLLSAAVSPDATRIYTVTIAAQLSRVLVAWSHAAAPPKSASALSRQASWFAPPARR